MGRKKIFNKNNSQFIDTNVLNNETYLFYEDFLKSIAISMFEWVNLPNSMDEEFLEECLYYNGMATLLDTELFGKINTACTSSGNLNIYRKPTKLNCYSYSFNEIRNLYTGLENEEVKKSDCILVYNSKLKTDTYQAMSLFAYKLYNASRIIDININAQKTPIVIYSDDKNLLTMQNLYNKYDGNEPVLIVNKNNVNGSELKTISTDTKFVAKDLEDAKKNILNEALTYLGINNISVDKKERLVTDEANGNNELVNYMLNCRLVPRQEACKQFNKLFGTNIEVRVRSDLMNVLKQKLSTISDFDVDVEEDVEEGDKNE